MNRRLLSLALLLALVCSLLPLPTMASDIEFKREPSNPTSPSAPAVSEQLNKPTAQSQTWKNNVLRRDTATKVGGKVLGSKIPRDQIRTVTILDTLRNAPSDSWDVSEAKDGSVLAWTEQDGELYDLYIAGEGGVCAPENCSGLFCGYTEVTEISFDGNFHTENAATMSLMFSYCKKLPALDVSDLDTSSDKRMECMFMHCYELTDLDLSNFDISKVIDMGSMFWGDKSLMTLTMPSLKDGVKRNTAYMFERCDRNLQVTYVGEKAPAPSPAPSPAPKPAPTSPAPAPSDVDGSYSMKVGEDLELYWANKKDGSDYHVYEWKVTKGSNLVSLSGDSSRTCTVHALKAGEVLIQVEYSYTTKGSDVLTGNPRTIHHTSTKSYAISIG